MFFKIKNVVNITTKYDLLTLTAEMYLFFLTVVNSGGLNKCDMV